VSAAARKATVNRRARFRPLLFPLLLLGAAAVFLGWLWLVSSEIRQMQMIYTYATALLGGLALLLWWGVAGAASRRARWAPLGVVVGAAALFGATFRIRGITGDWIPVVEPRFGGRDEPLAVSQPMAASEPLLVSEPQTAGEQPAASEPRGGQTEKPPALDSPDAAAVGDVDPAAAAEAAADTDSTAGNAPASADTASFPRFLGPDGDSVLRGVLLERDWTARPPRRVWQRPVGAGWSGFAIASGRAFTMEQRGEHETVVAYDLVTGNELWSHGDRAFFTNPMAGPGPRATPTVAGARVFTFGSTGLLSAFDAASGRLLWQHDVPREHDAQLPEHGMAGSPLAADGLVVVAAGGARGHSLVAYDQETGLLAWGGGDDRAAYGSPVLATLAGRRQILVFNHASVAGHDPRDGSVLWNHPWPANWPNVATPIVVGGDRVLFSTGYGVGSKLLRVRDDGAGALSAELMWETPRLKSKFANLALHEGFVYGLDDGVLVCLDPETGERRWKGGRYGHGNLLVAGDLLLVQTERGEMVLVDPTPEEHREIGRFLALRGKAWNPFALAPRSLSTVRSASAGEHLLVRNDQEAALWELPTRAD